MIIKSGTILTLAHGEYSDRGWDGPFKVLRDFDQAEIAQTFREQWAPGPDSWKEPGDAPDERDFIAWLTTNGYTEDLPHAFEWFIGGYGFNPHIS